MFTDKRFKACSHLSKMIFPFPLHAVNISSHSVNARIVEYVICLVFRAVMYSGRSKDDLCSYRLRC